MDTPWDSMVISNLCSVWRGEDRGHQCHGSGQTSKSPAYLASQVGRVGRGPYLKVVEELFEGHFLTVGLQSLNLKAIPQCPLLVIVLRDKEGTVGQGLPERVQAHLPPSLPTHAHTSQQIKLSCCKSSRGFLHTLTNH